MLSAPIFQMLALIFAIGLPCIFALESFGEAESPYNLYGTPVIAVIAPEPYIRYNIGKRVEYGAADYVNPAVISISSDSLGTGYGSGVGVGSGPGANSFDGVNSESYYAPPTQGYSNGGGYIPYGYGVPGAGYGPLGQQGSSSPAPSPARNDDTDSVSIDSTNGNGNGNGNGYGNGYGYGNGNGNGNSNDDSDNNTRVASARVANGTAPSGGNTTDSVASNASALVANATEATEMDSTEASATLIASSSNIEVTTVAANDAGEQETTVAPNSTVETVTTKQEKNETQGVEVESASPRQRPSQSQGLGGYNDAIEDIKNYYGVLGGDHPHSKDDWLDEPEVSKAINGEGEYGSGFNSRAKAGTYLPPDTLTKRIRIIAEAIRQKHFITVDKNNEIRETNRET